MGGESYKTRLMIVLRPEVVLLRKYAVLSRVKTRVKTLNRKVWGRAGV